MGSDHKDRKYSIKILLALLITVLFVLTGIVFALYFHKSVNDILVSELNERGKSLAKNLASNSRLGVILEDRIALGQNISDVLYEKDVVFIMLTDASGRVLMGRNNENEKKIKIPASITKQVAKSSSPRIIPFEYKGLNYVNISSPIRVDDTFYEQFSEPPDNASGFYERKEGELVSPLNKGQANIVFTLEYTKDKVKKITQTVIIFIILITSIGILLSMIFIRIVIKPIEDMIDISSKIADGDITKQVKQTAFIEFDGLSKSINKISGKLREILNKILSTVQEITNATDSIQVTSKYLFEGAKEQADSVNSTSVSVSEVNDAIKINADNTKKLLTSAELTSASMNKISDSIETISVNTSELSESIDNSSSSIIQMTSSIKEIAKNTDELSKVMNTTSDSAKEMDKMIHIITEISNEACSLSEKVKTNASDLGLKSIEKMSASMDKIKESVDYSSSTIKKLGETSDQIGEILTVIEAITEQTSLLALNAAILAAQAGKHGKGFAVVADEIKALADRTATSTKEITGIIQVIQEDVTNSVKAVAIGKENVKEGVKHTEGVVKAFEYIFHSADISLNKANDINKYSQLQSKQVDSIKKSIEMMANMVHHVVKATNEQKNASEHIMQTTERISGLTTNIKNTINEQSDQSKHVSTAINDITNNINMISASISQEAKETENIVATTNKIKNITSKNVENNNELSNVIKRLLELSQLLKDELKHFKL